MWGLAVDRWDRRLKLKDEIRGRLESICNNLEKKDFELLVEQIAENSIKGELRPFLPNGPLHCDRPSK